MPPIYHSSDDDEYNIGPPLDVLVAEKVMEKIIVEREYYDKNLQEMMERIMTAEREKAWCERHQI